VAYLLLRAAAVAAVFSWIRDLWVRAASLEGGRDLATYALSFVGSFAFWLLLVCILIHVRKARPGLGRSLAWGAGVVSWFLTVLFFGYIDVLSYDPPSSALSLILRNPQYGAALVDGAAGISEIAALTAGPLLAAALLDWASRPREGQPAHMPWPFAAAVTLASLILVFAWPKAAVSADLRLFATVANGLRGYAVEDTGLPDPNRLALPSLHVKRSPDVLLIIHESLTARQWHPWSCEASCSPATSAFLAAHPESTVWFPRAIANSSATDVSVPSLLSGLPPDASAEEFARAPLAWHYARSAGYRTGFFTAQKLYWANLDRFLVGDDAPDAWATGSSYGAKRVNDNGVDDAFAVRAAVRFIEESKSDVPLFVVVQLNATHRPGYYTGLEMVGKRDIPWKDRYERAAAYVDDVSQQLVTALEKTGRLERTLVINTADHGEEKVAMPRLPRMESMDEPVLLVPLWIHLPQEFIEGAPESVAALRANTARRVANWDIVPTLLDMWGQWPPADPIQQTRLPGKSLFRPLDAGRHLIVANTGEVRAWDRTAFAMYYGDRKWLVDEKGAYVFDPIGDPHETTNLLSTVSGEERQRFLNDVQKRPQLLPLLKRLSPTLAPN
jgi:hypothetical protein